MSAPQAHLRRLVSRPQLQQRASTAIALCAREPYAAAICTRSACSASAIRTKSSRTRCAWTRKGCKLDAAPCLAGALCTTGGEPVVSVAIGVEKLTRFRADAGGGAASAQPSMMTRKKYARGAAKFELHARAMGRGRGGKGGKGGEGGGSKLQRF